MNKEIIKKIHFFKNKPPHFIAFIGPLLKPLRVEENNFVYKEGDPIEDIYFLTKGKAVFVSHDLEDNPYLMIDQGHYFGEMDFVYKNYLDNKNNNMDDSPNTPPKEIPSSLKRAFSIKATENCDMMTLSKANLARVDSEFEEIIGEMFFNAHRKIKKTIKIKKLAETAYLHKQA